jgi:peptidyl-prolyl cis-trans isomerase C
MRKVPLSLFVLLAALALAPLRALAQEPSTVLLSNSFAKVTKAEYDAELTKLPPDMREGFANNPRRVNELLLRILVQKSLAEQARRAKLDVRPDNATRLALEVDRFLAGLEVEAVEAAAAAEFNAQSARFETRAKELYLIDKTPFTNPPQISATHILFDTKKRTPDEAKKLAAETRAKIAAGADMGKLAREISDDPTAGQNGGQLGWFSEKEMDAGFSKAAFALAKAGDLSEPVQSQFGWHLIRLDGKRPPSVKTYEEARDQIMAELRKRYIEEKREAAIGGIRRDPATTVNRDAVSALTPKVDPETVKRAQEVLSAPPAPPK